MMGAPPRGQGGLTLVEVLIALAIAALLIVPLGAWTFGTLRAGFVTQDELGHANATGLLNTYFLRDVTSASGFATEAEGVTDCSDVPSASAGLPVVRLLQSGETGDSVVYTVGAGTSPVSLYRNECAPDGSLVDSTEVLTKVVAGSATASCADRSGTQVRCDHPTAVRVSMEVEPWSSDDKRPELRVSGTRRTTGTGAGYGAPTVFPRVSVEPGRRGYSTTVFVARNLTRVPETSSLTPAWTLPPGAALVPGGADEGLDKDVVRFTMTTSGSIGLSLGGTLSGWTFIEIVNRPPVIDPGSACTLVSGQTFDLLGIVSDNDPGDVATAQWLDPTGAPIPAATWTAPAGLTDDPELVLIATDQRGASSRQPIRCPFTVPAPGDVSITPTPNGAGTINQIQPGGFLDVTFGTADPGVAVITWELFRKDGTTPVESASGASWTRRFTYGEAGEYEVVRSVDGSAGPRVPFRLNAVPTLTLTSDEQAGVVPARIVTIRSTAADPDGTIVSARWDFGDGSQIDAPAGSVTHTYTAAGVYEVRFTVVDSLGGIASVTLPVTVPAAPGAGG